MADLTNPPNPEDATKGTSGGKRLIGDSFWWMLLVGLAWGLFQLGKMLIGRPVVSLGTRLSNSASEATEGAASGWGEI